MSKIRYIERKYLCKYDLKEEFFTNIDLEVLDITPLRKLYILECEQGKKILKRVECSKERLDFINKSLEYINKKFNNTMKYDILKDGKPYVEWKGDLYTVMSVINGREVTYTNEMEVKLCAQAIAKYHKSGEGIKEFLENELKQEREEGGVLEDYQESLRVLDEIYSRVSSYKYLNEFDKTFLNNYEYIRKDAYEAIDWINNKVDYKVLIKNKEVVTLCHNDLAHHNFLIDEGIISLLDFDYCKVNLRVVDVGDFLVKSVKNVVYDVEKGMSAFDSYNEIIKLTKDELNLLYAILVYPKEIITIIRDYYFKRKDWEEEGFISKFIYKIYNEDFRREFGEAFKNKYL